MQELSFTANKKKTYSYYNSKFGDQITKIAGFVGKNASGKTNIMRLFGFIHEFICISSRQENQNSDSNYFFKTFFNNKLKSDFSIEFEKDNKIVCYAVSIKNNVVISESLYLKEFKNNSRKKRVFKRIEGNKISLNKKYFKGFKNNFLENIRFDVSLVAFLKTHYNIEVINFVFDYFLNLKGNFTEQGSINSVHHQIAALNIYLDNPGLKKKMEKFVSRFDLGLSGFDIIKIKNDNKFSISVTGLHAVEEENNKLSFSYESRGTQSLFFILANIFYALEKGGVVVIDEIESGFHPEALAKLISYFIDESEKLNVQLIFSSNFLDFMNKLDMHQVYLVNKDEKGSSFSYRLNQIKNIRSDENFYSKYMSGAYGAFPKIRV